MVKITKKKIIIILTLIILYVLSLGLTIYYIQKNDVSNSKIPSNTQSNNPSNNPSNTQSNNQSNNPSNTQQNEQLDVYSNYPPGTYIYNRIIDESYRTYSSFWDPPQSSFYNPSLKESTLDSKTCWGASSNDMNQWINISLPVKTLPSGVTYVTTIAGIVIRARGDFSAQYVTLFKVNYINSSDKTIPVDNGKTYNSNLTGDLNQISYILFTTPVNAKNIIILPQKWVNHISLRADLLINKEQLSDTQLPISTQIPNVYLNAPTGTFIYDGYLDESYRTYSSSYDLSQKQSTLDSPSCWSVAISDMNQWINIRLPSPISPTTIAGVVIRARGDRLKQEQYVTSIKVNYINSSGNTIPVDNGKIYNSNLTGDSKQFTYILFEKPVNAKNIIIIPYTWVFWIALRADLLISDSQLSDSQLPIVTYSSPISTQYLPSPVNTQYLPSPVNTIKTYNYIGDKIYGFTLCTVESDSNGNKPNITSNVINNIDLTIFFPYVCINNKNIIYSPKNINPLSLQYDPDLISNLMLSQNSYNPNHYCVGYQIQFFENTLNNKFYTFNVTELDYKTNRITFNSRRYINNFKLNGSEAWPFDINLSTSIPPPKILNLPAEALVIATSTTKQNTFTTTKA